MGDQGATNPADSGSAYESESDYETDSKNFKMGGVQQASPDLTDAYNVTPDTQFIPSRTSQLQTFNEMQGTNFEIPNFDLNSGSVMSVRSPSIPSGQTYIGGNQQIAGNQA